MRLWKRALAGAIAAAAVLSIGPARSAEPLKIRVGWIVLPATWAPILYEKKENLRHYGTSYVVDPIHFQGTPLAVTALATNEVDIAGLAFSSFATAIQGAGLDDLRVVADEFQDGVEGYAENEFTVLKSGPIHKVEDLKGKVLAANANGSAVDMAIRLMLRKHRMDEKKDVTIIEAALPSMNPMLMEGKVDLISSVLPFSLNPEFRAATRVLFTEREAMGRTQFSLWAARAGFIAKNHAVLVDFMEDTLRAARWFVDPANHKEVVDIVARATKRPPESFAWAFTKKDYYRDPNLHPDLVALQSNMDMQRELGFLNARVDAVKHADLSLVDEAAQRLK